MIVRFWAQTTKKGKLTARSQAGGLLDQPMVTQVVRVCDVFDFITPTKVSKPFDDPRNSQAEYYGSCEFGILRGFPGPPSIIQLIRSISGL